MDRQYSYELPATLYYRWGTHTHEHTHKYTIITSFFHSTHFTLDLEMRNPDFALSLQDLEMDMSMAWVNLLFLVVAMVLTQIWAIILASTTNNLKCIKQHLIVFLFLRRSQALCAYQQQVVCVTRLLREVKTLREQVILHFVQYLVVLLLTDRCQFIIITYRLCVSMSSSSCVCVCVCVCVCARTLLCWVVFQLDLQREEVERLNCKLEQEKRKRRDVGRFAVQFVFPLH